MTQREIVVRVLAQNMGNWIPSYDLQKVKTEFGWLGVDSDTRAHELSRDGFYESANFRYTIEHRRNGKYAEFRCSSKEKLSPQPVYIQGVGQLKMI